MKLSVKAQGQYRRLVLHYEKLERSAAIAKLNAALRQAAHAISRMPRAGLPAPRPYPQLADLGLFWVKAGPYWIAYKYGVGQPGHSAVIMGIFYDRSNMPGTV